MAFRTSIDVTVIISVPVADAKDPAAIMSVMSQIEACEDALGKLSRKQGGDCDIDFGDARIVRHRVEVVKLKEPAAPPQNAEDLLDIPGFLDAKNRVPAG